MKLKGHLTGGTLATLGALAAAPQLGVGLGSRNAPVGAALALVAGLVGCMLPDLDHAGSAMGKRFGWLWRLVACGVDNPVAWYLVGALESGTPPRRPKVIPWWLRLLATKGGARHEDDPETWRFAARILRGRSRLGGRIGHRGLSHSLVAIPLMTTLWLVLAGTALVLAAQHAPTLRPYLVLSAGAGLPCLTPLLVSVLGWAAPLAPLLGVSALGFVAGYASHILLDLTTRSGCKLLSPFSDRTAHLLPPGLRYTTE